MRTGKHLATLLSLLLSVPVLVFCMGYLQLTCGEYDPCDTGGWMPYAGAVAFVVGLVGLLQGALIIHLWTNDSDSSADSDLPRTFEDKADHPTRNQ